MSASGGYEQDIKYNLKYYESSLEPNLEMSISINDQQRVFLAYRALFQGSNSSIRQPKAIKRVLSSRGTKKTALEESIGHEKTLLILKLLLEKGIFSSELKAKLAFPILYETSPEQDARHEASDVGAAKEEAEALREVEILDNTAAVEQGEEEGEREVERGQARNINDVTVPECRGLPTKKVNGNARQKDKGRSCANVP